MSRPLLDVLPEISKRIQRASHLLLCADFDGTLTPLVDDPASARLAEPMRQTLESLSRRNKLNVVIISGRPRDDLQARINIPGLIYAGNHGLEISGSGFIFVEPTAIGHREQLHQLASELGQRLQPFPGVFVEDKGLTLTVHFRKAAPADSEEVRRVVHAALASANYPFVLASGKAAHEISPRVYWNEGSVIGWIKERLGKRDAALVYFGDDATDEGAFVAFPNEITVRVGTAPDSAAQFEVEGPPQVEEFLRWLNRLLG
jgi:trehalose 6-phosphate phosphatase